MSNNNDLIEANRERLLAWEKEGRSYFWMATQIGVPNRSACVVSAWFRRQGICRKVKK